MFVEIHSMIRAHFYSADIQIEFLPPYSPDLNPIEEAFLKVKAFIHTISPGLKPNSNSSLDFICANACVPEYLVVFSQQKMSVESAKMPQNCSKLICSPVPWVEDMSPVICDADASG
jgi:hypothetical protein